MKTSVRPLLARAAILAMLAAPLFASKITPLPKNGEAGLRAACSSSGDLFLPAGVNGVYGCIKSSGSSAFCGGVGGYKNNCTATSAKVVVQPGHMPTQAEVRALAKAAKEKPIKTGSVQEFLKQR